MSLPSSAPPCLLLFIKTPEGGRGAFAGPFGFPLVKNHVLWAVWCGKLLKGKRIVEGKNY
jgi:hypothetical protein